jgi:hypothetical protein
MCITAAPASRWGETENGGRSLGIAARHGEEISRKMSGADGVGSAAALRCALVAWLGIVCAGAGWGG